MLYNPVQSQTVPPRARSSFGGSNENRVQQTESVGEGLQEAVSDVAEEHEHQSFRGTFWVVGKLIRLVLCTHFLACIDP